MNPLRFWAVLVARNREFLRDHSSLAWNILFPVLIVLGFSLAFSDQGMDLYKVGVLGEGPPEPFFSTRYIDFIPQDDPQQALVKVERHQLDMLVDRSDRRFWINDSSPKGYVLERVLGGSGGGDYVKQAVRGQEIRYVDWVLPGVLGMNMMFSALFGVGYVIVRYRKSGMLKRLKATPLTAFEFLAAQVASRLWLILIITALVYVGTDLVVDFRTSGSFLDLFVVFSLGAISLISLSLVVASRTASEELAGGLLNLFSWPMMFLSGVWFSLEGGHPLVQQAAQLLPLTHVVDAARAIMVDGAGLVEVWPQLLVLGISAGVFLALGSWLFRWE